MAVELAGEIAANGPLAVQLTKALMPAAVADHPTAGRASAEQAATIFQSADAAEGAAAFIEKRPPRFTGH